jgi:hypothetical protein
MMEILTAGVAYFAVTYTAGFVFGSLREILVVPRLGPLAATLIEAPLMLLVTYFAALWVVGRFDTLPSLSERLAVGGIGFALLIAAEIIFSGLMRGWSFGQWLTHLKTADGAISLAMFLAFAVMPLLVGLG